MCIMWAYVGTTTTALFVSFTDSAIKKQVALSHFGFNFITALIFSIWFPQVIYLIRDVWWFGGDIHRIGSLSRSSVNGVVIFIILFRCVGAVLFIPFIDLYTRFIWWAIPYRDENKLNIESINKEVSYDIQRELLQKDRLKFQQDVLSFDTNLINSPDSFDLSHYKGIKDRFNKLFAFISNFDYKNIGKDMLYGEKYLLTPMIELMQSAKSAKDTHTDIMTLYDNKDKDNHYNFVKTSYNKALEIISDGKKNENKLDDIIHDMDEYESKLISAEMKDSTKLYPDLGIVMHTFNNIEHSLSNLISAFQVIKES